ncbi:MAG: CPBP family intramembrane glutamic endopeptidase [Candidatus Pacearchaeota archaeon]|jgi:membrane protease YdiL (CAAX protease family)
MNKKKYSQEINKLNIKKILFFVIITYFISFSMIFTYLLLGGKWVNPTALILSIIYMFIPAFVAIIIQKFIYKEKILSLGIYFKPNWWFLIAIIIPIILAFSTFLISLTFPNVTYSPSMEGIFQKFYPLITPEQYAIMKEKVNSTPLWIFLVLIILQSIIAGSTINTIAAFGEELGWRGFLYNELKPTGFWISSLLIGLIWGIWHFPIILQGHNYPTQPYLGVIFMIIWCILLTPLFIYIRIKSNSVIAASLMHGVLNASYLISILWIVGGNDLTVGITGLAGFLALIVLNIIMVVYDKKSKSNIILN